MLKDNEADGHVAQQIAALAMLAKSKVEFVPLPKGLVPAGATVAEPHLAVKTDGRGGVETIDVKPLIEAIRGKPAQRKGTAKAATVDSFIDLVNRSGDGHSAIFIDPDWRKPKFTAVLDYNLARSEDDTDAAAGGRDSIGAGDDAHARFGNHRVVYEFPQSESWKQWLHDDANQRAARKENPLLDQEEFAKFIEDHIHEITSPTEGEAADLQRKFRTRCAGANDMLDLARGLEVTVGRAIKSQTRLASGERAIVFTEEHATGAGQPIDVPGLFLIEIPLFYRGDTVRVTVLLRYRATSGGVKWAYELYRPDEIVDSAVRRDVDAVAGRTGLPCYDGAPESA